MKTTDKKTYEDWKNSYKENINCSYNELTSLSMKNSTDGSMTSVNSVFFNLVFLALVILTWKMCHFEHDWDLMGRSLPYPTEVFIGLSPSLLIPGIASIAIIFMVLFDTIKENVLRWITFIQLVLLMIWIIPSIVTTYVLLMNTFNPHY